MHPSPLYRADGPIAPRFVLQCVRDLLRALPLATPGESDEWLNRRLYAALHALAALNPRHEVELLYAVQGITAYHAAAHHWWVSMNVVPDKPANGFSPAYATAAFRVFDAALRSLDRLQSKPLPPLPPEPEPVGWDEPDPVAVLNTMAERVTNNGEPPKPPRKPATWTPEAVAYTKDLMEKNRIERDNKGLDIANTEGILPGGGMVVPRNATPNQTAYLSRRMAIDLRRQRHEAMKKGITVRLKIPNIAVGDFFP